jgi:hypothetical protein
MLDEKECQVSERVGDRDIASAVTAAAGAVIPDGTRWTVVMDADGHPTAAISPGGTSVTANLVIVDATMPLVAVLGAGALADAPVDTVVVVSRGPSVVGVWSSDDLIDALVHGVTREASAALPGDIQLPGRISKRDITRLCRHAEDGRACATVLVVPEKPDPMPPCPAQTGISAHTFAW